MADPIGRRVRQARAQRSGDVTLHIRGDGLPKFADAVEAVGSSRARRTYVSALNHTGARVQTAVIRALAKQVGLPSGRLRELGRIKATRATASEGNDPSFRIKSSGAYLSLGEFRPSQFSYGVKANPWGRSQRFPSAFIFAGHRRSGQRMPFGGVFQNSGRFNPKSGRNNLALPLYGPAVPKEIVQGESKAAFEARAQDLGARVAHELRRLTKGAVT